MPVDRTKNKIVDKNKERSKRGDLIIGETYVKQKFNPKSLALIHKFNLQGNPTFSKMIQTYQSIEELGKKNPKYKDLTIMWEDEFNFLFEAFWIDYHTTSHQKSTSKIAGWKERLNIDDKGNGSTIEDKKLLFMNKIKPSFQANYENDRTTRKDILERAGFKEEGQRKAISFVAQAKTRNLNEIENLINDTKKSQIETSDLGDFFKASKKTELPPIIDDDIKITQAPDPGLSSFLATEENKKNKNKDIIYKSYEEENKDNEENKKIDEVDSDVSLRDFLNDDSKRISYIDENTDNRFEEPIEGKKIIPKEVLKESDNNGIDEIPNQFYREEFKKFYDDENISGPFIRDDEVKFDENTHVRIDPNKRNILSKEDFIYTNDKKGLIYNSEFTETAKTISKPYHEIKPVGVYDMEYDPSKRPSTIQSMYYDKNEEEIDNELQSKIKILRELKEQRRHRINMFKIEKSNNSTLSKAIEFRNRRELRHERRKNIENMKALERIETLRSLQERQRLVNLLKQRQLKLEEEKRVESQIKLERQKNLEREAKYRMELASIESQIHREMELINSIEIKTKAQYLKNNPSEGDFDKSLLTSKEIRFNAIDNDYKNNRNIKDAENKRQIELLAQKFKKNI